MGQPLAINIDDLSLKYQGSDCLDIPSLAIEQGETILLFGENGSGKTSLMKVLSGLIKPDSGSVSVLGHQLTTMTAKKPASFGRIILVISFRS